MSSLVDRFRSGAGKAAFEADKLRRLQSAQSAIKPLRSEADRLFYELGKLAYVLYTQGGVAQPELRTAGERLAAVHAQIAAAEAEVERIRAEEFVEPLPSAVTQGSLLCPNGHGALVAGASFCQTCGAAGVRPTVPVTEPCQNCGAALEPNARFCAACGTPVARCANCGATLVSGAAFCAECGTPVQGAAAPTFLPTTDSTAFAVEWQAFSTDEGVEEQADDSMSAPDAET